MRINQTDSNHPFSYFIPKEPDNLANWADGEWATADGKYRVHVGGSSADTPLEKNIPMNFELGKDKGKGKGKGKAGSQKIRILLDRALGLGWRQRPSSRDAKQHPEDSEPVGLVNSARAHGWLFFLEAFIGG